MNPRREFRANVIAIVAVVVLSVASCSDGGAAKDRGSYVAVLARQVAVGRVAGLSAETQSVVADCVSNAVVDRVGASTFAKYGFTVKEMRDASVFSRFAAALSDGEAGKLVDAVSDTACYKPSVGSAQDHSILAKRVCALDSLNKVDAYRTTKIDTVRGRSPKFSREFMEAASETMQKCKVTLTDL